MDDKPDEKSMPEEDDGATRIPININSTPSTPSGPPLNSGVEDNSISSEPTAPDTAPATPEPGFPSNVPASAEPSAPASPEMPAPEATPIAPPAPGAVIGVDDNGATSTAPSSPPQVVVSSSGGSKRWLKVLVGLLIIVLLCLVGWVVYDKVIKSKPVAAPAVKQNTDISLLKIGILQADYGDLYPNMSLNANNYLVNAQMFDGLVRYENKTKLTPDLATSWTNPDSTTWVFTIKKNVKFHDGHTMTADDVKTSIDNLMASTSDYAKTFTGTIASVATVGMDQVKITTKAADPTLLNKLTFVYITDAKLPQGQSPSMGGTGPYEIKPGTTPSSTSYQMVPAQNYSGSSPSVHGLDFGSESDQGKLVSAFKAGQYNIAGPVSPSEAQSAPNAIQFITSQPQIDYIGFNTVKSGPLQNKLVREAIRYAISPQAINGARDTAGSPTSQLLPDSISGYNPSITTYKQNVDKAKQLLTQAGYPNGLTIRYSYSSDSPQTSTELTKELKAVGITLTPDPHANLDEFINYVTTGQADMYTADYASDTLDGLDIYQTTLSGADYNNPQFTALLTQAGTTTDPAKRQQILQNAAKIVDQDVAAVPISTSQNVWLMDKGYAINQDMPDASISVYFSGVHLK
ncbi:MAG TPA: ABC transporter substrate-binding protein [Candidatus Saccharimonadales bacterium]|nr:ABC transporter substrate-binding protein [Candidatus Saccharimonadales bacterium]